MQRRDSVCVRSEGRGRIGAIICVMGDRGHRQSRADEVGITASSRAACGIGRSNGCDVWRFG